MPTFGVWGFGLASPIGPVPAPQSLAHLKGSLRFLNDTVMLDLFDLPVDMARQESDLNRLNDQALVRYYEQEWGGNQ